MNISKQMDYVLKQIGFEQLCTPTQRDIRNEHYAMLGRKLRLASNNYMATFAGKMIIASRVCWYVPCLGGVSWRIGIFHR